MAEASVIVATVHENKRVVLACCYIKQSKARGKLSGRQSKGNFREFQVRLWLFLAMRTICMAE